jgi:ABC-type sulfate/molybdate transport systems ATPase subunit
MARIAEVLRLARIEALAARYPSQLSGGEQQRVALRPRRLLLDEPMSSLDAPLKAELLAEFAGLRKLLGVTAVYLTHDPAEAQAIAQHLVLMREGSIERIIAAEAWQAVTSSEKESA